MTYLPNMLPWPEKAFTFTLTVTKSSCLWSSMFRFTSPPLACRISSRGTSLQAHSPHLWHYERSCSVLILGCIKTPELSKPVYTIPWHTCLCYSLTHLFTLLPDTPVYTIPWHTCLHYSLTHLFTLFPDTPVYTIPWHTCLHYSLTHLLTLLPDTPIYTTPWHTCLHYSLTHLFTLIPDTPVYTIPWHTCLHYSLTHLLTLLPDTPVYTIPWHTCLHYSLTHLFTLLYKKCGPCNKCMFKLHCNYNFIQHNSHATNIMAIACVAA